MGMIKMIREDAFSIVLIKVEVKGRFRYRNKSLPFLELGHLHPIRSKDQALVSLF